MDNGYMRKTRELVDAAEDGTIFVTSDFADIADATALRQCLKRLVEAGLLRRIKNGIYEKPRFSSLLNEYVAVDPEAVANAMARNYHWTIAPSGEAALNLLGLSTQVPAIWSFISDGPYKTVELDNTKLEFKHRTNREITGLSYKTRLVIQALKTLGEDNITSGTIAALSNRLTKEEKKTMLKEATESTDWVYDTIRKISGEK